MKDFLKKFSKNTFFVDIVIITILIFCFSYYFSNNVNMIFSDRGREFIFSQAILDGYIPYKDICIIYFPLSYYINALIFKVLGVSINSLIITQTALCSIFVSIFYLIAREFLSRKLSLVLTIFIISSCIFTKVDIFNYIFPYSYGRVYGLFGCWGCIFSLIKLFKTDKPIFAYTAALASGFSASCKLEFLYVPFLLILGLILYKKLQLSHYFKILGIFLFFPLISVAMVILSGVSLQNIFDTINFCIKFSYTPSMIEHLSFEGMYPIHFIKKLYDTANSYPVLIVLTLFCFIGLFFEQKLNKKRYVIYPILIFICMYFENYNFLTCWYWIPITVFLLFCLLFKKILPDKTLLFFMIATLVSSQREFFGLTLQAYGTYSLPLLLAALCIIIFKFCPEKINTVKTEKLLTVILILLTIIYTLDICIHSEKNNFKTVTKHGTLYTDYNTMEILDSTTKYIESNTNKNDTVLVLPEGNIINFITDRKVDLKCFMMDRLYYDAYGEDKATEMIKNSNSDYIIITKGLTNDFFFPYLYDPGSSPIAEYIYENYTTEKDIISGDYQVKIMKKNKKNTK